MFIMSNSSTHSINTTLSRLGLVVGLCFPCICGFASQRCTSILGGRGGGGGGLDLTSSLEAKFGASSGQVHQIRGKTWEVLLPQDAKVGKKSQFCGHT